MYTYTNKKSTPVTSAVMYLSAMKRNEFMFNH